LMFDLQATNPLTVFATNQQVDGLANYCIDEQ
jgi:hypothetical protein